jgi:hypothetical protein
MNRSSPFLILAVLFTALAWPVSGRAQHCEDSTVFLGRLDSDWLYRNESLGLAFPLPQGWYFYDYLGQQRKYLRVGSDYRLLSSSYVEGRGATVQIPELKRVGFAFAPTLLSLARLDDSANLVTADREIEQKMISFRACYADTSDTPGFLIQYYRRITHGTTDTPAILQGQLGGLHFDYFSVTVQTPSGQIQQNWFGARKFGCFYLLIRIIYQKEEDLEQLREACQALRMGR